MNISRSFVYFPKLMIYGSMGVGGHHNLAKEPYKIITPKKVYICCHLIYSLQEIWSLWFLLPGTYLYVQDVFFEKPKTKQKRDENGNRWMRIQICFQIGLLLLMEEW